MREIKYKLTISLMVSNRKDTVPKTLESLKPILDNVSSELIVTDTGCDEDLLDIIRQYTDKIIKFTWCNDFSKARNVSIEAAKGEWYMYIDDDEWFEDVTSIIDFFNSGESDRYNAIDYIQRNYWDFDGSEWRDTPVGRTVRLTDTVKFVDAIHEHFSEFLEPIKMVGAYVHHYGYVYKTKEEHIKHARRNLDLLEKQMEEGNHCLRQYVHMLQEYNGLDLHEKAYEMAIQGLEKANQNKEENIRYLSGMKANAVYSLYCMAKYDEAKELAEKYIREGQVNLVASCSIYLYLVYACYCIEDIESASDYVREYFSLRKSMQNKQREIVMDSILIVEGAFKGNMPNTIFNIGLMCAVVKRDKQLAELVMSHRELIGQILPLNDITWLQELLEMMADSENKALYAETIVQYMDDLMCATKVCGKLLDYKEKDDNIFMELTKALIDTKSDNNHVKLLNTIYCGLKGNVDSLKKN